MILIRNCEGFDELEACVEMQVETWGYDQADIIPRKAFLVMLKVGGQLIGAFDTSLPGSTPNGDAHSLIGFAMSLPGVKPGKNFPDGQPRPYLHSHMLAVREAYRNQGIGAQLKLEQRREALSRGIRLMEWTFDPLEIKNAFLNIHKLGAVVSQLSRDFYGVSSSRLQGGLPTDRLVAEWQLDSPRVRRFLKAGHAVLHNIEERILVPASIYQWKAIEAGRERALDVQTENRRKFQQAFSQGLAVLGFVRDPEGNGIFELGPSPSPSCIEALTSHSASHAEGTQNMQIDGIILREIQLPLVRPFETSFGVTRDRRILLAEVRSEGLIGWGECTAGEHPFFSGESTDTCWQVIVNELGPMLAGLRISSTAATAPACSSWCALIAWPRPLSKMLSGTSKRSGKESRSPIFWAACATPSRAAFRWASRSPFRS